MTEVIRLAHHDELSELLNLYKYLHEDDPDVSENTDLEDLWNEIGNDQNSYYIVADLQGKLVSTCNLTVIKNLTRNLRPYGLIENVVTHPDYREKGLATKVLKKAIEIARDRNCYKVVLLTSSKKDDVLRFYARAGFERGIKTGFYMAL